MVIIKPISQQPPNRQSPIFFPIFVVSRRGHTSTSVQISWKAMRQEILQRIPIEFSFYKQNDFLSKETPDRLGTSKFIIFDNFCRFLMNFIYIGGLISLLSSCKIQNIHTHPPPPQMNKQLSQSCSAKLLSKV